MNKVKLFIILAIVIVGVFSGLTGKAALVGNTNQATMSLSPESGAYNVNTQFQIIIYLNTNGLSVNAVAAHFNYSPSLFQVASIDYTGSIFTMQAESEINNSVGTVKISRGVTASVNTSNGRIGVLNIIGLTAAAPSSDNFTFSFTAGDANRSNVFLPDNQGTPVLSGVYNGRYTISGGADTTPPTAPTNLAGSVISSTQINLSWTASTDNVGVTGYRVERCQGSTCTNFAQIGTPTGTTYSNTGLSANIAYRYRVRAVDAAGNLSSYSNIVSVTTSCRSLSFVNGSVSPSSVSTGGSYTVTCDYGATTNAVNPTVGSGSCTFSSFSGNAARFSCTAGNIAGTFNNSCALSNASPDYYCARTDPIVSLTVTAVSDTTAPSVPANLSATAVSSSQINLTWTVSTDNIGVTGYRIYRCQGSGCTPSVQIATSLTNSYANTGLTANTTYVYRVAAYDGAGNVSGQSASASIRTQVSTTDTTAPSVPTGVSAIDISSSQINLTWTASTDNVGVAGYRIYRCQGSGCTPSVQIATSLTNSYANTGLTANTTYVYRVAAYDGAGNVSAQSTNVSAKTKEATTPTPAPTPTPTSAAFTKDLYLGIKDSQVQALQELLAKYKTIYPEGSITGFYGILTQIAVQRFQCQYNIICSGSPFTNGYGMVGPKTRTKLNELYAGTLQPATPALPQIEEEQLIEQLKTQIKALQEKIVGLLNQLIQLLQEEIKKSGGQQ